jgi:hypothetical protein
MTESDDGDLGDGNGDTEQGTGSGDGNGDTEQGTGTWNHLPGFIRRLYHSWKNRLSETSSPSSVSEDKKTTPATPHVEETKTRIWPVGDNAEGVEVFLVTNGQFKHYVVTRRQTIIGKFSTKSRALACASEYATSESSTNGHDREPTPPVRLSGEDDVAVPKRF